MTIAHKILWGEGLFLRPQHFQQQDLYHEQRLSRSLQIIHPHLWGVKTLKFDTQSLAAGMLRVLELEVVFPDGVICQAPGTDELPAALNLASIDALADASLIYLSITPLKPYGANANSGSENGSQTRYTQMSERIPDLYTKAVESDLLTLKHALRLTTESDATEQTINLPIAKIRKSLTGGFELDGSYIPPSLSIQSSPPIFLLLRRLLDLLEAKVNTLYGHHREPTKNIIEFRSGDHASFWLLYTASTHYARLLHLYQNPQFHPERLHQEMLALAGALMTFSKNYALADLPSYQHNETNKSLIKLDKIIRDLLDTVLSTRYFAIPISEIKPSLWQGRLESEKIDANTNFYLAIASSMPPSELVDAIPLRVKVGAPDDVEKLVLSAMPGVPLSHAPQVPTAIPVKPGYFYFAVNNKGALYEQMVKAQSIAIYTPSGFPELKIELIAVV